MTTTKKQTAETGMKYWKMVDYKGQTVLVNKFTNKIGLRNVNGKR